MDTKPDTIERIRRIRTAMMVDKIVKLDELAQACGMNRTWLSSLLNIERMETALSGCEKFIEYKQGLKKP